MGRDSHQAGKTIVPVGSIPRFTRNVEAYISKRAVLMLRPGDLVPTRLAAVDGVPHPTPRLY